MDELEVRLELTLEECERLVEAVYLAGFLEGPQTEGRFRALQDKVYSAVASDWRQDFLIYVEAIKRHHPMERVDEACQAIFDDAMGENRKTPPSVAEKPRDLRS